MESTYKSVLSRLGFEELPSSDLQGLEALYRAWSLQVPFDNIRKATNLLGNHGGPLPGTTAEDFFQNWLSSRAGGTCWPTANALASLLERVGFETRRATASVFDLGSDNHGTVIVRLDGRDWLVDTSFPTLAPLPLVPGEAHLADHSIFAAEVDPEGDSFFIWNVMPPFDDLIPFRMLEHSVKYETYHANYERSREMSIFNDRLFVRRSYEDKMVFLASNRRFERTPEGTSMRELSADELVAELGVLGYSAGLVEAWIDAGGLAASMKPREPSGWEPEITRLRPSLR